MRFFVLIALTLSILFGSQKSVPADDHNKSVIVIQNNELFNKFINETYSSVFKSMGVRKGMAKLDNDLENNFGEVVVEFGKWLEKNGYIEVNTSN